jgi:hypothetical protein
MSLTSPQEIAEKGEEIYKRAHQARLEASDRGKFVAVDVATEKAYVGLTPAAAYEAARRDNAVGPFHLIKVGDIGAFRVSYSEDGHARRDWLFR